MKTKNNILALILLVGLTGSFISMLEWDLSAIIPLFTDDFSLSGLGDGFLLVFNRLFAISEQHQLFRYVMFPISLPESYWAGNTAIALIFFMLIFAVLSFALTHIRSKAPILTLALTIVAVQVYFGVFPSAMWNIILFSALALIIANKHNTSFQSNITVVALLALISTTVFIIHPNPGPQLSDLSEAIRDRFDAPINPLEVAHLGTHDAYFQPTPEDRNLNVAGVEDTLHQSPTEEYFLEFDEIAQGAEIGLTAPPPSLLPAVLLVIALIIVAVLFRFVPPLLKASKRRKAFDVDDSPTAINNMFIYLLEWLAVIGLEHKNVVFSAYTPQLSNLVSQQYSEEYKDITALWQKAMYSNQTPKETERQHMKDFLNKTKNIVWSNANLATKLKIKLHHFL